MHCLYEKNTSEKRCAREVALRAVKFAGLLRRVKISTLRVIEFNRRPRP